MIKIYPNSMMHFFKGMNESKIFAGLIIIILNVGGKLIPLNMSKSAENIVKTKMSRDIIVFAIAWMGTRDIFTAGFLTLFFVVLSDFLLNYDSKFCCVPLKYRQIPVENDMEITDEDLNKAINILEQSKKNKMMNEQHEIYLRFFKS
jgi:hypothetical protein